MEAILDADVLMIGDLVIRKPREEPLALLPTGTERRGNPGRVWELFIPGATTPPISANDQQGPRAGIIVNGKRRDVGRKVGRAIRAAGWPQLHGAITVGLVYYLRNNGWADADNIAPTLKPCLDAMKPPTDRRPWGASIIPEDHSGVVRRTWQEVVQRADDPHPELGPRVLLVVVEVA